MSKQESPSRLDIDLALTFEEKRSELWGKACKVLEDRIWKLMLTNARPQSEERTAEIRTEIKVLRGLLKNDPAREFSEPRKSVSQDELDMAE